MMKKLLPTFFILSLFLLIVGCRKDSVQFGITTFKVNDQFVDANGKFADDAILRFEVRYRVHDDVPNDYFINSFEFGYQVNGSQFFVLERDTNMGVQSFSLNAIVDLLNIDLPVHLGNQLVAGDRILFSIRATDSCGVTIERQYEVVIV